MQAIPFLLVASAALWLVFELAQVVLAERCLALRRTSGRIDPLALPLSEKMAAAWTAGLFGYWLWLLCLLVQPDHRAQAAILLGICVAGLHLRRSLPLRWTLGVLITEGVIRIAVLCSIFRDLGAVS